MTDTLLQVIQPLINSVSVYYVNKGINVDFGAARGVGSLSYAAASYLLGGLVERYGCSVILVAGFLMVTIISATVFSMPIIKEAAGRSMCKILAGYPFSYHITGIQRKRIHHFLYW